VKGWLARTYGKPGNVFVGLLHRLDRQVAGVVLFARTSKAASRMSEQFRERRVDKIYWALVQGRLTCADGSLKHFIEARGPGLPVIAHSAPGLGRKEAKLSYRTLWLEADATGVEVTLETGRKHQIRAQFSRAGHPILGDVRYRAKQAFAGSGIALVAKRLAFIHPVSKQAIQIEVPNELCPLAQSHARAVRDGRNR
jgi:23S rRNA pseudouridine1911/1915/1917 synthase